MSKNISHLVFVSKKYPFIRQYDQMDCGPTCLRMLSKFYGKSYSSEYLSELASITKDGASLGGLADAAEDKIASISEIATQENRTFLATVALPNGLKTNANKTLTYKNGMDASAEIVTEDLRLIERFLYQLRKIFQTK